ncbi:hypothetical protein [Phocaeicola sp.]
MFSVKVSGVVLDDLGNAVTERGFCYSSTSQDPTIYNSTVVQVSGTQLKEEFSTTLTGLAMETNYYVRAYAKNKVNGAERVGYGEILMFTTSALMEPNVMFSKAETSATDATLYGQLRPYDKDALQERGFIWSEDDPEMTIAKGESAKTIMKVAVDGENFNCKVTGLKSNTRYYVRAYAIYQAAGQTKVGYSGTYNSFNTSSVQSATFKDLKTSSEFSTITASTGISNLGDGEFVEKGFCWIMNEGSWESPTLENCTGSQKVEDGTNDSFSFVIKNLLPSTQYGICAYVKTKLGEETVVSYSSGHTLSTRSIDAIVSSGEISGTTCEVSAYFHNDVTDIEEYGFCWTTDESAKPSAANKKQSANLENSTFSASIDGLSPGITYYIRVYVICQEVTTYSNSYIKITTKRAPGSGDNVSPDKKD